VKVVVCCALPTGYRHDRKILTGQAELHVDLALEAINYKKVDSHKLYTKKGNSSNTIVDCPYFTTNFIPLDGEIETVKTGVLYGIYVCSGTLQ
jgi:mannose-6-phosphate isomerase